VSGRLSRAFAPLPWQPCLPGLQVLRLDENNITSEGAAELAVALRSCQLPLLQVLDLSKNAISDAGMLALAETLQEAKRYVPKLGKLYAVPNPFTSAGRDALASSVQHSNVTVECTM